MLNYNQVSSTPINSFPAIPSNQTVLHNKTSDYNKYKRRYRARITIGILLVLLLFVLWLALSFVLLQFHYVAKAKDIVSTTGRNNAIKLPDEPLDPAFRKPYHCTECRHDRETAISFKCHGCVQFDMSSGCSVRANHLSANSLKRDNERDMYKLAGELAKASSITDVFWCHDINSVCHQTIFRSINAMSKYNHLVTLAVLTLLVLLTEIWLIKHWLLEVNEDYKAKRKELILLQKQKLARRAQLLLNPNGIQKTELELTDFAKLN